MSASDPSVIPSALDWLEEGRRVALATVIQTWGSAPRPVGSQLAIDGGGNFLGSVSGGCVEGEVISEAAEVLLLARPKTLDGLKAANPFIRFHNTERGYVRCEVTPKQWRSDYVAFAVFDRALLFGRSVHPGMEIQASQ